MMLKYCPKRQHFSHKGMIARAQLAALDHNHNCSRKQAVVKHGSALGSLRYNLVFPKVRKTWMAKPIKEEKSYGHLDALMESILQQKRSKGKKRKKSKKSAANIAHKEKPEKQAATKVGFTQNNYYQSFMQNILLYRQFHSL